MSEGDYEKLLNKAYEKVKIVEKGSERFEIPKATGQIEGNQTFITNIYQIADYLRRPVEHLAKFLQKELAVPGRLDSNRLMLKAKLSSDRVNERIGAYARDFVICPVCGKPDTELVSEKGIKLKHCLACGAKSPVRYHL